MEQQQQGVEQIHARIRERYPMYIDNPGFEQWLLGKAGGDLGKIDAYLTLLDDYGYITGDGTLANDYQNLPDPEHVTEDIARRLASLSPDARTLLKRASVQGARFNLELVAAIDGSTGIGAGLVDEAIAAGVVAHDGAHDAGMAALSHHYRFVPQQAAATLYQELPEEERSRYHTALVEYLSDELGRTEEMGAQDMLAQMINEHNRRFALPDSSPSKD